MADAEVIQAQMEETRNRLAENLDKLTKQTSDTVQEVAASVSGTVEAVQESVQAVTDTVHETVGGVKDFFDLPGHVERHPWLMIGGAAAVGFMVSQLLARPAAVPAPAAPAPAPPSPRLAPEPEYHLGASNDASRLEGHWPEEKAKPKGFFEGLTASYGPLLDKLKSFAIGAAMGVARNMIAPAGVSGLASDFRGMIDNFTTQLGGQPIAEAYQDNNNQDNNQTTFQEKGSSHERRHATEVDRPVGASPR